MNETIELIKRTLRDMWHRRWIGLLAAWIVALVGIVVVSRIPDRYEASARVFVDTESLLKPLLAGVAIQPNIDQQVSLVGRTLISRPNVERVVRMADLDLAVKTPAERDEIVDSVMKSLSVSAANNSNLYNISYRSPEPEQARKVVQSLLTIFVESSLGDKRQDSQQAVRFIDEQIKNYERSLQAAENRLKEFKLRYLGFAERNGGGDYFSRMGEVANAITAARLELQSAEQARDSYKRELAGEQPIFLPEGGEAGPAEGIPELDVRLAQLKKELDELSRRYTDNHPDVQQTKRLIADLEQQRATELAERRKLTGQKSVRPTDRNPVFQQLRLSLAESEAQVASLRAKLNGLEAQYSGLRSRASLVPEVEAEFAQLNRDYEVQKKTYETLLARRESATMGIGVQDSGGTQFRVIDPPRVSQQPVAPNRLALLGAALLASIGAGLAMSLVMSQLAPTFHDPRTLTQVTNRPVLGAVSALPSATAVAERRRGNVLFAGGLSGLLAVFAAVAAFVMFMWRASA